MLVSIGLMPSKGEGLWVTLPGVSGLGDGLGEGMGVSEGTLRIGGGSGIGWLLTILDLGEISGSCPTTLRRGRGMGVRGPLLVTSGTILESGRRLIPVNPWS